MGYDAGPDPDTSGTSAVRLCDEYPAKRQPDKDRSGSTGVYDCRGNYECDFIYLYEQEKGTVIFLQVKNAKQKSGFSCQMEVGMLHFQQKIKGMRFSLSNKIT